MENVLRVFKEVVGEDLKEEIVRVTRKGDERDGCLGTVLVSLRSEETRRRIMREKKYLKRSNNKMLRNLVIKNMRNIY